MEIRHIREYLLREGNSFETLEQELGIKARVYPDQGVVSLNYNQIESPKTHPIVMECRSLILYLDDYSVASRKFTRFFNVNEAPDTLTNFQFTRAHILEKVDGSLIGVWYNRFTDRWEISTRSMAFAEGEHQVGGSFREHILSAFKLNSDEEFQEMCRDRLSKNWSYVFEWVSPMNRIVTVYDESMMVLTGAYHNTKDGWLMPDEFPRMAAMFPNTRPVRFFRYDIDFIEELKDKANDLDGLQEGFVVWDPISDTRQKVKSLKYMALHAMRGDTLIPSPKNLMKIVLSGEISEVTTYFPEWSELLETQQKSLWTMLADAEEHYNYHKEVEDQKQFALKVKDHPLSALMFMSRRHNTTIQHEFNSLDVNKQLRYFGM